MLKEGLAKWAVGRATVLFLPCIDVRVVPCCAWPVGGVLPAGAVLWDDDLQAHRTVPQGLADPLLKLCSMLTSPLPPSLPRRDVLCCAVLQLGFFLLGLCCGALTFKAAGQIHLEAYYAMPKGKCRSLVGWMAVVSEPIYRMHHVLTDGV